MVSVGKVDYLGKQEAIYPNPTRPKGIWWYRFLRFGEACMSLTQCDETDEARLPGAQCWWEIFCDQARRSTGGASRAIGMPAAYIRMHICM
jgi:hypothetical protein